MIDLKKFRLEHCLKQSELATMLGVNQSTISWIEGGRSEISMMMIKALKDKFGEEEIMKYNFPCNSNSNNINIGSAIGNNNKIDNSDIDSNTLSIIKDYQETIADLRRDKEDLKSTIKELKQTISMYKEKYGTM